MTGSNAMTSWFRKIRRRPLGAEDEMEVIRAIVEAEKGNRGEVRVHIESRCPGDALERAREQFFRLGMDRTAEGTGVLLYVAEKDRRAAVYAGPGIHGAADERFWQLAVKAVAEGFSGEPARGITGALAMIGELLRAAAPGRACRNELPDEDPFMRIRIIRACSCLSALSRRCRHWRRRVPTSAASG